MNKEDDGLFENSAKFLIPVNTFVESDIKVIDHYDVTGKHKSAAHRNCNIKINPNYKIPIVFQNIKKLENLILK